MDRSTRFYSKLFNYRYQKTSSFATHKQFLNLFDMCKDESPIYIFFLCQTKNKNLQSLFTRSLVAQETYKIDSD